MAPTLREFWVDLTAGWVSGAASVLVSQPMDTVLTRLQMASAHSAVQTNVSNSRLSLARSSGAGSQAWSLASRILQEGGSRALWRGATPMTMVIPVQNAMLFAGYGVGERWARESKTLPGSTASLMPVFAGGFTGGVLQSFVVSPVELLKIQQQAHGGSVARNAAALGVNVGTAALWRGLGATLLRDGLPHGVWFLSYEWSKQKLLPEKQDGTAVPASPTPIWIPLVSGAFAATAAWGVGYPFDTIKTRIQASAAAGERSLGVMETATKMVRETGGDWRRALYRGFGLKLMRAIPASMIGFLAYEQVSHYLL